MCAYIHAGIHGLSYMTESEFFFVSVLLFSGVRLHGHHEKVTFPPFHFHLSHCYTLHKCICKREDSGWVPLLRWERVKWIEDDTFGKGNGDNLIFLHTSSSVVVRSLGHTRGRKSGAAARDDHDDDLVSNERVYFLEGKMCCFSRICDTYFFPLALSLSVLCREPYMTFDFRF